MSQHSFDYELPLGKWSFIGAWAKGNSSTVYPNGTYAVFNYLVNYHRWGNYSAHFGLRAATTTLSDGEAGQVSTDSDLKNAVITWGYEHGATQNRLIFQSFQGVDVSGTLPMTETEWATILSNGNIGSGLSAPTAQFQLKQLNSTNYPLMEMLDNGGISKFMFTKTGELFLGPGSGSATTTATTVLDIKGNVKIIQNTTATANVAFDVTGNSVFRSPSTADLAEKTINVRCNGTADNFWMSYGGDMYYYKYKAGTTTAALV